ncbi:hypothetical protein VDG1235_1671 [Verrucomicrobiia bacterium DG1235]|nr:hypothetical protein VDG1235_1671 [Verrucomicrobiae bacterium DG1235]
MKRIIIVGGIASALLFAPILAFACPSAFGGLAKGETEVVYTFESEPPFAASPEGIAIDRRGNKIVTLRTLDTDTGVIVGNELVKIDRWGGATVIADFGPAEPGLLGALGVIVDRWGNAYVAVASGTATHGVWRVDPDGEMRHLDGSEGIFVPNTLTFDNRGNLYVSDSYPLDPSEPGLIWRYGRRGRVFEIWASDHLLAPDPINDPLSPPPPAPSFPLPGVNGIAFYPPNHIYAVNSEKNLVLHVPIMSDGTAGAVETIVGTYPPVGPPDMLFAPDGLAVDVRGNLYTVNPPAGFTGFPVSPLVKIDPRTGEVEAIVDPIAAPIDDFDFPTSLAFGTRFKDRKTVFTVGTSSIAFGLPPGAGPRITQVGVGVPGRIGR